MSLEHPLNDVWDFHRAFGHPHPAHPTAQPQERAEKRAGWIKDECDELIAANTLVDQADAYIDILYFGFGGLVELGIDPTPLWKIVQSANMAKLGPDGQPIYHPDGKVAKPEGWKRPEPWLAAEVQRQAKRVQREPIVYGEDLTTFLKQYGDECQSQ